MLRFTSVVITSEFEIPGEFSLNLITPKCYFSYHLIFNSNLNVEFRNSEEEYYCYKKSQNKGVEPYALNCLFKIHNLIQTKETPKYFIDEADRKKRSFELKNKGLYLRRVACLGKNGEMIEVLCCTDNHLKPWMILLPTKHKTRCYTPSCQHICYFAIVEFRKSKTPPTETPINNTLAECNDYIYDNDLQKVIQKPTEDNDLSSGMLWVKSKVHEESMLAPTSEENYNSNPQKTETSKSHIDQASNWPPTVTVPEVILELLDLCNCLNNSDLFQFEKLNSLCKMKNMNLKEFLKHVNYNDASKNVFVENETDVNLLQEIENEREYTESLESSKEAEFDSKENYYEEYYYETSNATEFLDNAVTASNGNNFNPYLQNYPRKPQKTDSKFRADPVKNYKFYTTNKNYDPNKFRPNSFEEMDFPLKIHVEIPKNDSGEHDANTMASISIEKNTAENNQSIGSCCCTCTTKCKSFIYKERLKNMILMLLRGPRPVFANKTKFISHVINKGVTTELDMSSSPNTEPSYTVLEAEKPTEKISLLKSHKIGESVEKYIEYIDKRCTDMYKVYKKAQWDYETNVTLYTRQRAMTTSLEFNQLLRDVNKELTVLTKESVRDIKLKREIKLLFLPAMDSLPAIKSNEFEQVLHAMETIYSSAMVRKWNQPHEKVALNPVIANAMASSENTDELKYYWIEWRKVTGKQIRPLFEQYASLMSLAAEINGFNDASEMWTRYYESEDLIDAFNVHWETVKPLYMELHAYVRHKLHDLYGDAIGVEYKGKIPAHLTGDIWSKNWKNLYYKIMPFHKRDVMKIELRNKITPHKLTEKTEKFFLSMGFTELPPEFWKNSILTKDNKSVMLCEPSAWDMGDGRDFRIKLCATPNMEDLLDIHHLVALTEYYKEYRGLPFAFRNAANPGFSEGVAGAMVLSAQTKSHLKMFGIRKKQSESTKINKLLRIALEKVAFIPYSYILVVWRNKVFTGEINDTNYNYEWWKLRSQYQGISPPIERTEDDFDVGSKQHIAANQPYIKYFLGTILQFQFYEALCKKGNFHGTLHECDLTGSAPAGRLLRNMMSMGSTYHWKVALQEITGTRKIDSKPLMRYFEPLLKWLQKKNKEQNVKVGWEV